MAEEDQVVETSKRGGGAAWGAWGVRTLEKRIERDLFFFSFSVCACKTCVSNLGFCGFVNLSMCFLLFPCSTYGKE